MKNLILILTFVCCSKFNYAQLPNTGNSVQVDNNTLGEATMPAVQYHLTARPWEALNVTKDNYLYRVEGIVRQIAIYQNPGGAIIDPYAGREVQYATPYFANAVGTLLSAGRAMDLLNAGVAAMNSATNDVATGASSIPDDHGEFFLAPLSSAISLYSPYVSKTQAQTWKDRLAKPRDDIIRGYTHNWRTYAMKGEWLRAKNEYVNKDAAVSWLEHSWIKTQKNRFINNPSNFYHDNSSDPDTWPYESVARSNLISMIAEGYDGASRNDILTVLEKGTMGSLLLQDPSGQGAAGGRSGNHTWNDILSANGYETMAEMAFKNGNTRLAGQYRHAAAQAFQSIQRWRRPDGTYSVTKNLFNPADRTRYANYSFFTNYNGNVMYHLAENYLKHISDIAQQATPNEIGGYTITSDPNLATAVANAGGMHMQVCLRGSTETAYDLYWTTLGVVRFARPGWDSRLGPSDGVRETGSNLGVSFAPTFLEGGKWVRLASVPERYEAVFTTQFTHPLLVRCRVEYKPKNNKSGPAFSNDFVITPDGIISKLTSTSADFGITWPVLAFDGATRLDRRVTSHIVSTSYPGEGDEQNFIALDTFPVITTTDSTNRSSYGDLLPVRMVSGAASNVTFIYPRNSTDPSAESVRNSYVSSGKDFSTILGKVKGDIYIGRTSAGGVGQLIDINEDSIADVTFNVSTGFVMQLENSIITKIETDKDVTAEISGRTFTLRAYTPVTVNIPSKLSIARVIASADDGNIAINTIDGNYETRWSVEGNNEWIRYDLDTTAVIRCLKIAWYKGNERKDSFDIQTSTDSITWRTVFSGRSGGNSTSFETVNIPATSARYVRISVYGNDLDSWNAITEVEILQHAALNSNYLSFTRPSHAVSLEHGSVQTLTDSISTTNNLAVNAALTAVDDKGNIPSWLSVNGGYVNELTWYTGSKISFTIDAANLSAGEYFAEITASAAGYTSVITAIRLTVTSPPGPATLTNIKINFQDSVTAPPVGWLRDYGQAFGLRNAAFQGTGNHYGWIKRADSSVVDLTKNSRIRTSSLGILQATLMHMQGSDLYSNAVARVEGIWQCRVENGNYKVTVSAGDDSYLDSRHSINIEGVSAISNFVPSDSNRFKVATVMIPVSDGSLTVDAAGGTNSKINYIIIEPDSSQQSLVANRNLPLSSAVSMVPGKGVNTSGTAISGSDLAKQVAPTVYPNPGQGIFHIRFPAGAEGKYDMQLSDALGRTYSLGTYLVHPGGPGVTIDISKLLLGPGVYFLRTHSNTGSPAVIKLLLK